MKNLKKNVVYDLSDLNDDELNKVLTWLVKNDKGWSVCTCRYLKGKYIKFEIDSEQWVFYNGYENLINAKTLFSPKVNIINPTESNYDKTIENLVGRIIQCKTNELTSFTKNDCYVVLENNTNNSKLPYYVKDDDYTIRGTEHYISNDFIDKYFELVDEWKSKQGEKVCIKYENHNCDENIEKDSILEVILKNKLLELREDLTDLENLLLHNTNLNDYSKTEIMKNITFINRQSDVLNDVLKDCEIYKLKQQCEN